MRTSRNMEKISSGAKRGLVWLLISAILNPAFTIPLSLYSGAAEARDTDIYLASNYSGGVAEPAIMLILDTSDSMNITEPWQEYPGAYDSHVEYLWNDTNIASHSAAGRSIYNIGCTKGVTCADGSDQNNDTPPTEGTAPLPMGYFAPAAKHTAAAILQLQADATNAAAAKVAAIGAEPAARATALADVSNALGVCGGDVNLTAAETEINASTISPFNDRSNEAIAAIQEALTTCAQPEAATAAATVASWNGAFDNVKITTDADAVASAAYSAATLANTTAQADRKNMKLAAAWYAGKNDPLDPGPRSRYRNYTNNGNWVWWVPSNPSLWVLPGGAAAEAENDNRLRSNSFSRFAAGSRVTSYGSKVIAGNIMRGGTNYGGVDDFAQGNYNAATGKLQEGQYNKCVSSMNEIMPSTVFAPGPYPKNAGKWENQRWMRWERFRGLNYDPEIPSAYSGAGPVSVTPQVDGSQYPGEQNNVNPALSGGSYARGYAGVTAASTDATTHFFGIQARDNAAQPIRIPQTSSYAGWKDVRADLGGYNYQGYVNSLSYNAVAGNGSLNEILGYYGVGDLSPMPAGVAANTTTSWRFSGWQGNFGAVGVDFGKNTGTMNYYDGTAAGASNGTISHVSTSGTTACTRTCTTASTVGVERDFRSNNDNVLPASARGSDLYGYDSCTQSAVSDPSCSAAACSFANTTSFVRSNIYGCGWSGRQSKWIEGVGTLYYGGTCSGSCKGETCAGGVNPGPNTGATYCNQPSSGSPGSGATWVGNYTIDGVAYANVTNGAAGTCSDKGDTSQTCNGRTGLACTYSTSSTTAAACPNRGGTYGGSSITFNYKVYNRQDRDDYLIHDCVADNGKAADVLVGQYNPGASYLNDKRRNFAQTWNANVAANPNIGDNDAATTPAQVTESYTSNTTADIEDDADKRINVYATNYLNWKFGAKVCRDNAGALITAGGAVPADATCSPVGRKTRLQTAKDALVDLVKSLNGVRFGLMVFNKMDVNDNSQGANVVAGVKGMGVDCGTGAATADCANRDLLINKINALTALAKTPLTESLYEAHLYFKGAAPYFGTETAPGVLASSATASSGGFVTAGRDASVISAGNYISPTLSNPTSASPAPCQKNYVVMISDGGPWNDISADTAIQALTQTVSGTTYSTQLNATATHQFEKTAGSPYGPPDIQFNTNHVLLDELAYFMANTDHSSAVAGVQKVNTFTIGFAGGSSDVLKNAAAMGNGIYQTAENSAQLKDALSQVFAKIRDWSPSAAAASVPISAFNRSENADEVYLAFFGPTLTSRWNGTVKRYRIGMNPTTCGDDVHGNPINFCLTGQKDYGGGLRNVIESELNLATGDVESRVKADAESFWFQVPGGDGASPQKGGSGEMLLQTATLNPSNRHVFTLISSGASTNVLSDATNALTESNGAITGTLLGNAAMSPQDKATLINFARGGDANDGACSDNDTSTACTTWREWPHQDVLHSTPAILTYDPDPDSNPATDNAIESMFYMSNDGLLHAINSRTGEERWTFMAEEALTKLSELKTNNIGEHVHGGDGSPVLFLFDAPPRDGRIVAGGDDRAFLFFGLRRGGRAYYGLDVTDMNNPAFMWKITPSKICPAAALPCNDNTTDSSHYVEMGETWSTPSITRMRGIADPVMVFGGGYDPVMNDHLQVSISHDGAFAYVTTNVPHGYTTGDTVKILGATSPLAYNGEWVVTVTGANTFKFALASAPLFPPAGDVRSVNVTAAAATMGRGLFFTNAVNGSLIKSFTPRADVGGSTVGGMAGIGSNKQVSGMNYAIPSDALVLNTDLDVFSNADRLYMGDLGGNLWRFDVSSGSSTDDWRATQVANLSGTDTPKRKIFFPPAMVKMETYGSRFDAVYIGTGDRENPLSTATTDKMFMLKDDPRLISGQNESCSPALSCPIVYDSTSTDLYDITNNDIQLGDAAAKTAADLGLRTKKGWVMSLNKFTDTSGTPIPGEKVINQPVVFQNVLRFGSYNPLGQTNACTPPGKAVQYAFNALDGSFLDLNRDGVKDSLDGRVLSDFGGRGYESKSRVLVLRDPVTGKRVAKIIRCLDGNCQGDDGVLNASRTYWYQEPEQ